MMRGWRTGGLTLLRVTGAIVGAIALIVTVAVLPIPTASAKEHKTAVFGTVVSEPHDDRIDIATRSGVMSLIIDEDTKLRKGKREIEFSDVRAGMTVAGYYAESDDGPVAKKLKFKARKRKWSYEHVVGVVLEKNGDTVTVQTSTGEHVVIDLVDATGTSNVEPGSLIATVVEVDATTGELTSTALQTAQETVERLSAAIDFEISLAQRQLLEIRMSETAAVHMTRLYETLDEIKAESQARIQAAYAEYQASYDATLKENSLASVAVQMSGRVLGVSASELHVESLSDGTRWDFSVTAATVVELSSGTWGTISDIVVGQTVEVSASPGAPPAWPVARVIRVLPADDIVAVSTTAAAPTEDTITGTIVLVQTGPQETGTVVVVSLPDGSDSAASLTEDTVVIVDGEELDIDELEVGQEVEIALAADGFSAEKVTVGEPVEQTPVPDDGAPNAPVTPPLYTLIGTLRSISETGVVLDGVQLTIDNLSTTWGSSTVGQQIELEFYVDSEGRLVVRGTK